MSTTPHLNVTLIMILSTNKRTIISAVLSSWGMMYFKSIVICLYEYIEDRRNERRKQASS